MFLVHSRLFARSVTDVARVVLSFERSERSTAA
jgi:hypothetical protein